MIIGINAINLRAGGGLNYILSLVSASNPNIDSFKKLVIWGNSSLLDKIEDKPWIIKVNPEWVNCSLIKRIIWQIFFFKTSIEKYNCDLLFVPGGSDFSRFRPIVGMSQNMLPFEYKEIFRYGFSLALFKFLLLRLIQSIHFRNVDGVIFLTNYAKNTITNIVKNIKNSVIIPHGINSIFIKEHNFKNKETEILINKKEINLLYISNIEYYKHQWNVIFAVSKLREEGFSVKLELIGAPVRGLRKLNNAINKYDPFNNFIKFRGELNHSELCKSLDKSDIFIFASSCENLPMTLLEVMASGIPIASSDMGPMQEVLADGGVYFNPLDVISITNAVRLLINSNKLRIKKANKARLLSNNYRWNICARSTFNFLSHIAITYKKNEYFNI